MAEAAPALGLCCIDGRASDSHYGSPGGDAGLVIRTLVAYKEVTGNSPTRELVMTYIKKVNHALGKPVYIHTDSHAEKHYIPELEPSELGANPENIGCGYIKACVAAPQSLGDRGHECLAEISVYVIVTVYDILKAKPKRVGLVVLEGEHSENKVIVCNKEEQAFNPKGHRFIYHPKNEDKESLLMIDLLCEVAHCEDKKEELIEVTRELNKVHWEKVIAMLAPNAKWKTVE